MQKGGEAKPIRPPQTQKKPGLEKKMKPQPVSLKARPAQKLGGKVALITGGDSGIGRGVALLFASEGASVAIAYLPAEKQDANEVQQIIENELGGECLLLPTNLRKETNCAKLINAVIKNYGKLDIIVNNAGTQTEQSSIEDISSTQLYETFETNIFPMFWIVKHALKHLRKGSAIINTTSVVAYRGSAELLDYSATKGAIAAFTRSLSANLAKKGIRVNAVAPGPIWTPLIVSSFKARKVAEFGSDVPMARAGQPGEVATAYLFLASDDASYITGQVIHVNGGEIVNG